MSEHSGEAVQSKLPLLQQASPHPHCPTSLITNKTTKPNSKTQLLKSLKMTEWKCHGYLIPRISNCQHFSLMMFSINYHPTLIILFEQIFHSHFLLSVEFLLCFNECYKNTQILCFLNFLIESLIFLLLFLTLSLLFIGLINVAKQNCVGRTIT